jgi:hypothetical protein
MSVPPPYPGVLGGSLPLLVFCALLAWVAARRHIGFGRRYDR